MVEVKPQREKCQYHTDSPPVNVRAVEAKLGAEEGLQETRRLASVGIGKRAVKVWRGCAKAKNLTIDSSHPANRICSYTTARIRPC